MQISWQLRLAIAESQFSFCFCDKQHDQKQLGDKGLIWLTGYSQPSREAKGGKWRQQMKQKPWRNLHWLDYIAHSSCSLIWFVLQVFSIITAMSDILFNYFSYFWEIIILSALPFSTSKPFHVPLLSLFQIHASFSIVITYAFRFFINFHYIHA